MTLEEIYSELNAHMIKGLMVHDQMASYYCFLHLKGYAKCHTCHYMEESISYTKLKEHYLRHHRRLIKTKAIDDPKIIPNSWYAYEEKDIDATTKRNAVKTGLEKWIEWEQGTVNLYSKMYKELFALGEIDDAKYIECLLHDAQEELCDAESMYIDKKTVDFDISSIISDQKIKLKEYEKKIEEHCWCKK